MNPKSPNTNTTPLLIISIFICLTACKKDVLYSDALPIGDPNYGQVFAMDSVIAGGYWDGKYFEMDIDNDGSYDARFDVFGYGSPGSGVFLVTAINTLNDETSISSSSFMDTLFYSSSDTTDVQGSMTYLIESNFTDCQTSTNPDSLSIVEYTTAQTYATGDVVSSASDQWSSSVRQLVAPGSGASTPVSTYLGGDSTLLVFNRTNSACYDFPFNEERIIAFRKQVGSATKLAWVRFTVLGGATVRIHEWGRSF